MPRNDDPVDVNCTFLRELERSYVVEDSDGREVVLPKTETTMDPEHPDELDPVTVTIPEWLATDRGLV